MPTNPHRAPNINALPDKVHRPHARSNPQSAIVAEIASRLIEWRDCPDVLTESIPFLWLQRVARLGTESHDALWVYLHIQSGDLDALTTTYQQQAEARSTSRQAIEQRMDRALEAMSVHFPELKSSIAELRHRFRPARGVVNANAAT